ncbi:INO80 complex subunit C-like [Asterias rubens]|uniref:INO80 complex subunit C-like n=1 Tax=Asterias rubens TaxID=7604 RepID=UPI001455837A|nr:INO80 complex subunit C-like [Asterias rubens]
MSAPSPLPTRPRSTRIKRATSPAAAILSSKKKKNAPATATSSDAGTVEPEPSTQVTLAPAATVVAAAVEISITTQQLVTPSPQLPEIPQRPILPFKDANFTLSSKGVTANKKARAWKTLKQITSAEKSLPWRPDEATYSSIDAPPSLKPAKKYSDLSGFPAKYTDPQTKLRYSDTEEFSRTRMLPADIITGLLTLRKANPELQ